MKTNLIIAIMLIAILLYFVTSIAIISYLKKKLSGENFHQFKHVLGGTFLFKPLINGGTRYKSYYLWITIKAEFDHQGHLAGKVEWYMVPESIARKFNRMHADTPSLSGPAKKQSAQATQLRKMAAAEESTES